MRYLLLPIAVYGALVLQTTVVDVTAIGRVEPDLVAMVAAIWIVTSRRRYDFLLAGVAGWLGDLAAGGRVGPGLAYFVVAGYLAEMGMRQIRGNRLAVRTLLVAVLIAGSTLTAALSAHVAGDLTMPAARWVLIAGSVGLYTAAVAVPALMVVGWARDDRESVDRAHRYAPVGRR